MLNASKYLVHFIAFNNGKSVLITVLIMQES